MTVHGAAFASSSSSSSSPLLIFCCLFSSAPRPPPRPSAHDKVIPLELQRAQRLESVILTGNGFSNTVAAKNLLWGAPRIGRMNLPHGVLPNIKVLHVDDDEGADAATGHHI